MEFHTALLSHAPATPSSAVRTLGRARDSTVFYCSRLSFAPVMSNRAVIGIAGGTGAGKTAMVSALAGRVGRVCLVDLDSYYRDRSHLPPAARAGLNFDNPEAIDAVLLVQHLEQLSAGEAVAKPHYSFERHTRVGTGLLAPAPVILVEGLFTLWWPELRALLDVKVFVDAPADLRLARRIQRDVGERGRTAESVLEQYLVTVRPMYERYVEPTRAHADLVVTNDGALEDCVDSVLTALDKIKTRRMPG